MAKKILIVDDEPAVLKLLQSRLEANGYEVLTALDGPEGLAKARSEKPDLIILDVMLPKLEGYRVCRFLKLDENYKHIPILMLTSRVQKEVQDKALESGADVYLSKPFVPEILLANIRQLLHTSRPNPS